MSKIHFLMVFSIYQIQVHVLQNEQIKGIQH